MMPSDHQRRLEIGSHRERLETVIELGEMHSREAYDLLKLASEDIDPQIRDTAQQRMRESCWHSGSGPSSAQAAAPDEPDTESLF